MSARASVAFISCLVGALALSSLPHVAAAQDGGQGIIQMEENQMGDDERAKAHFRVGTSLYDSGRFNEAAEEWQKAYDLSHRAELLYNVYVAYRDAATSDDRAIVALRSFLEVGEVDATRRLQLEARLRAMEDAQAQRQAAATAAPIAAEPVAAPTAPTPAPAPTEASTGPSPVGPIVLMASGGALLAAAVVTGLMVNGIESDLEDQCPNDRCPSTVDVDGEVSKGNTLITINAITLVGGVAALGGGLVWLLLHSGGGEAAPESAHNVQLGCGPSGCHGSVATRF